MTTRIWQSNVVERKQLLHQQPLRPRNAKLERKPPADARRPDVRKPHVRAVVRKPLARADVRKPLARADAKRLARADAKKRHAKRRPAAARAHVKPAAGRRHQPNTLPAFFTPIASRDIRGSLFLSTGYTVLTIGRKNQTHKKSAPHKAPAKTNIACSPTTAAIAPSTSEPAGTTPIAIIV